MNTFDFGKNHQPFKIYRDRRGSPMWFQPAIEAFWIMTGRWSLHRAWQSGLDEGSAREYSRLIINKAALAELKYRYGYEEAPSEYDRLCGRDR